MADLSFRFRMRSQNKPMTARSATPPTVMPAIAPLEIVGVLVGVLVGGEAVVDAGELVGSEEDVDELVGRETVVDVGKAVTV